MARKLIPNPTTGELDYIDDTGGGGSQTPNYSQTFIVGDWTGPVSGFYSLSVLAATHGKGTNPIVQVYELNGSDYELVELAVSVDSGTGNINLGVTETPDERFEGKIVISENN